ncbi:hypothetical protein [Bradyrhizobium sp. USDA 4504]
MLSATDNSGVPHRYQVFVDGSGALAVFVDGIDTATSHVVADNMKGGVFGLFNDNGTLPLSVDSVSIVSH